MNTLQNLPTFAKGVTLRVLRSTYKLSQKAVAPVLKISQSTYSRMENEEKIYSPEEIERIITSFGFKPEDLAKNMKGLFLW